MSGMATAAVPVDTGAQAQGITAGKAILLPAFFAAALAAVALVPSVQAQPRLLWSILGAAGTLGAATLALGVASRGRTFVIDVQLRPQHYLQACAQGSVLLYWGWHWRPVYDAFPLLVAQLLFAYAFDILLAWSRRNTYTLGFAPFPVIFSINLFLWFKPDWFYLQFLMIAVGFAAKELIRWDKDGRRAHIFNPSSFPLAVFSLGLILTGTTSIDLRPGDRRHAVQSAVHLRVSVPHRLARPVLIRRDDNDDVGGGDDLPVRRRLLLGDRVLFLHRLVHPDRRLPRDAPALHRSVDIAANGAGPGHLRRDLRARQHPSIRGARQHRRAVVLRQAAAGADHESVDQVDRSSRTIAVAIAVRSRKARRRR